MDDTSKTLRRWATFAGCVLVVVVLDDLRIHVEITGTRLEARTADARAHARVLGRMLRRPAAHSVVEDALSRQENFAALPEIRILVGRGGPPALADESTQVLRDSGANLVASTLLETRTYLAGLVEIPRIPVPETNVAHAA